MGSVIDFWGANDEKPLRIQRKSEVSHVQYSDQ
jgi:hypothetical protein